MTSAWDSPSSAISNVRFPALLIRVTTVHRSNSVIVRADLLGTFAAPFPRRLGAFSYGGAFRPSRADELLTAPRDRSSASSSKQETRLRQIRSRDRVFGTSVTFCITIVPP